MRTRTKIWLIIAASLVLIGCILFTGVMTMLRWNFTALSTAEYETNTYEIREAFDSISINSDTADIVFAFSDDGKCRVECCEEENAKHSVTVENNILVVKINNQKSWYDYIGFHLGSPKITVFLPKTEYASLLIDESTGDIEIPKDFTFRDVAISLSTGDVDFCASVSEMIKIKTNTGDICVESISSGALDLTVSTGKIIVSGVTCEGDVTVSVSTGKASLTDVTCKNVTSTGNTGSITLKNVIAEERLSITRTTGKVLFDSSDAAEIFVETDTGDVTGTLLSEKVFIAETSTGRISVPKTTSGGKCEITTSTGDIEISIG